MKSFMLNNSAVSFRTLSSFKNYLTEENISQKRTLQGERKERKEAPPILVLISMLLNIFVLILSFCLHPNVRR